MFSLLFAILGLVACTFAVPAANSTTDSLQPTGTSPVSEVQTTGCVSDNFVKPWTLSTLVMVSPVEPSEANPVHVSFAFTDTNEDLVLNTVCIALASNDGTVQAGSGGYVGCQDPTVRFQILDGNELLVSRWYRDPCKGKAPYDSGIAFASGNINATAQRTGSTNVMFKQTIELNVTRMS